MENEANINTNNNVIMLSPSAQASLIVYRNKMNNRFMKHRQNLTCRYLKKQMRIQAEQQIEKDKETFKNEIQMLEQKQF